MWQYIFHLLVSSLAGGINLANAYFQLQEDCQKLPLFKPVRSLGFWIWASAQFFFPSVVFWLVYISSVELTEDSTQPTSLETGTDFALILESIIFGLGFVAVLNGKTKLASLDIEIDSIYKFFVRLAYSWITDEQRMKTSIFWQDLRDELLDKYDTLDFDKIYSFLEEYKDASVSPQLDENPFLENEIYPHENQVNDNQDPGEKVGKLISCIKILIIRRHLPQALDQFGCYRTLAKHFPVKTATPPP